MITQQYLKSILRYNPATGDFIRTKHLCGRATVGSVAGSICYTHGTYHRIKINNKSYATHRLAFLYMTGKLPDGEVDHINGDSLDNRWENLRDVDRGTNCRNVRKPAGVSGAVGVTWHGKLQKWRARISDKDGKRVSLGCFDSKEDAIAARVQAKAAHGYHKNHT